MKPEIFKDYEKKVLKLLTADKLTIDQLNQVLHNPQFIEYEYTGNGYYLTVYQSVLSSERLVCSEPIILGYAENIVCGFVIYVENNELTLECHSWGELNVPNNFREKKIEVEITSKEDMNNL